MATAEPVNNPVATSAANGTALPPPDKYRGAVVEVTQSKAAIEICHLADLTCFFLLKTTGLATAAGVQSPRK
jgi:hypothetical protein